MVRVIQVHVGGFDNNFSYLVTKAPSFREAVLIDPTGDLSAIEKAVSDYGLDIKMQIFTHAHPDHTELMQHFVSKKVPVFSPSPGEVGETEEFSVAGLNITVIHTPGHTPESVCFAIGGNIFSGDTIFVKGVGTTAYGGDDDALRETLDYLFTLNHSLRLWPGHNYGGASSSLGEALKNSHIKPGDKALESIKKKVEEYEKEQLKKRRELK